MNRITQHTRWHFTLTTGRVVDTRERLSPAMTASIVVLTLTLFGLVVL